jgi:hypothetical protein
MESELRKILSEVYRGQKENNDEAVERILLLLDVVGRSEQLLAFKHWERDKCRLPWDAEPNEIVEQYLSQ